MTECVHTGNIIGGKLLQEICCAHSRGYIENLELLLVDCSPKKSSSGMNIVSKHGGTQGKGG